MFYTRRDDIGLLLCGIDSAIAYNSVLLNCELLSGIDRTDAAERFHPGRLTRRWLFRFLTAGRQGRNEADHCGDWFAPHPENMPPWIRL